MLELILERFDQSGWQHCYPIVHAPPITNKHLGLSTIQVFHPQAEACHAAETTPIAEVRHQTGGRIDLGQETLHLIFGEDGWEPHRACGADGVNREIQSTVEHLALQ